MATELQRFKKWAIKINKQDTVLCHFYISTKRQVVEPPQYFVFNMLSKDKCWQIRGSLGDGLCKKKFHVPVLNCWKVDVKFFSGLKDYYSDQKRYNKYKYAILISKNKLSKVLPDTKEVLNFVGGVNVNAKNCWLYDIASKKSGVLEPFNYCKVVRSRIPKEPLTGEPIFRIPLSAIIGIMVQYGEKNKYQKLLKQKGMSNVKVFCL